MNKELQNWVAECLKNGTFRNVHEMIDFCVGTTKMFCEECKITQKTMNERKAYKPVTFPIDNQWLNDWNKKRILDEKLDRIKTRLKEIERRKRKHGINRDINKQPKPGDENFSEYWQKMGVKEAIMDDFEEIQTELLEIKKELEEPLMQKKHTPPKVHLKCDICNVNGYYVSEELAFKVGWKNIYAQSVIHANTKILFDDTLERVCCPKHNPSEIFIDFCKGISDIPEIKELREKHGKEIMQMVSGVKDIEVKQIADEINKELLSNTS